MRHRQRAALALFPRVVSGSSILKRRHVPLELIKELPGLLRKLLGEWSRLKVWAE